MAVQKEAPSSCTPPARISRPKPSTNLDKNQTCTRNRNRKHYLCKAGPGSLLDVLDILAGPAVVHPVLEVQSLFVQHRIAVIHRGTVIVEMCRHGLLLCRESAMLRFRELDPSPFFRRQVHVVQESPQPGEIYWHLSMILRLTSGLPPP